MERPVHPGIATRPVPNVKKKGDLMESRRTFISHIMVGLTAALTALVAAACGKKPDAETEPSPEWPPKE